MYSLFAIPELRQETVVPEFPSALRVGEPRDESDRIGLSCSTTSLSSSAGSSGLE